jgi:GntR family transcriptional regulator
LLEFRRGREITVTGSAPKRSPVIAMARDLLREARRHGVRRDELIQILESLP